MTRVHSSRNDDKDHRALNALASKMVGEGLDVFLCAHLHAPEIKEVSGGGRTGLFINVGDWWERDTYALERNGIFSLCRDREDERVWG
jgi:UDP-2,3-diacylglucosamine pyrophosphatase LpxH